MKQTIFTIALILVVIGLLSAIVLGSKNKKSEPEVVQNIQEASPVKIPIFFYGNTCPHCADVEAWMKENKIEEKVEIVKKEVYDDKTNAFELARVAESCGMDTSTIGVPFLYTPEGECLIGTPDITDYLSIKVGLSVENQSTESGKENEL